MTARSDADMRRSLDEGRCLHCGEKVGVPWVRCLGFPEHPTCHDRECGLDDTDLFGDAS